MKTEDMNPGENAVRLLNDSRIEHQEVVPILPVRNLVAFPQMSAPFMISFNVAPVIEDALKTDRMVGLLTVKDADSDYPVPGQLYEVGTIARILHAKKNEEGVMVAILNGIRRFKVDTWQTEGPLLRASVIHAPEIIESGIEFEALQRQLRESVAEVLALMPNSPQETTEAIAHIKDPLQLAYVTTFNMNLSTKARQELLEIDSLSEKIRMLLSHLAKEKEVLTIGNKIKSDVQDKMSKSQREFVLREQLKAIQEELGETEESASEADLYAEKIEQSDMSAEARKEALRELGRLRQMSTQAAEYPLVKTYLDWLIDLPWETLSDDNGDIPEARRMLDEDHYGLKEVKERLVEYIAVRRLIKEREGAVDAMDGVGTMGVILCLVGPPGVGKTSLGRSVARSMGRAFTRMSLGGVRDEAEIRGHRRTYVGALPGRILQSIKRAGTRNPVFILDEIDKVGQDWRGDPSSALLEVLDPAQNNAFRDHYLDVDFDLSEVIFIATANQLDTIPAPLRDRMEIIQLDGYTSVEKTQIAKQHLIPRQLRAHSLKTDEVTFMDDAIAKIIHDYTREAGVRNLERHIAAICRKGIVALSENGWSHVVVTKDMVRQYLKKEHFENEQSEAFTTPGIAAGLAVTAVGGDILYIEASRMPGKGHLSLTGQLGSVMKESAQIALSYVRSRAESLGIDPQLFDRSDIHLHVPAGALPKDGPSAGVAMAMTLASLLSGQAVRSDVGITGEITLRGRVLPVGGIKMKALAAHRAGLTTVVLPRRNEADIDDLPDEVRKALRIVMVDRVDEAVAAVFRDPPADLAGVHQDPDSNKEAYDECDPNTIPLAC